MTVECLVCDNELDADDAASVFDDEEQRYYFCSEHCREQFDEEPELFLGDRLDDEAAGAPGAVPPVRASA